jgi:hemoglobin/transferrin/lactoferrin receptor protein
VERRRTGWTLGVGAEYAITGNWSVKGEYAYAGFGEEDFNFPNARQGVTKPYSESVTVRCTPWPACFLSGGPPFVTTTTNYPGSSDTVNGRKASNAIDLHTIKIGLNYRF